jgi:hypothetical protein
MMRENKNCADKTISTRIVFLCAKYDKKKGEMTR